MVGPIAILLVCHLLGEITARLLSLPVPGPVIGLAFLVIVFLIKPEVSDYVSPLAKAILANLSLLFVPAGVGVIGNIDVLSENWLAFGVILVVSTIIAMLVSAGTFLLVYRVTGGAK